MSEPDRRPLCEAYDTAVLDLDGVVYIGERAVAGAAAALEGAVASGMHLAFVTNNASRSPEDVAAHLRELGVAAEPADVVTSAQAAAGLVAQQVPSGAEVYVIGGPGLETALRERGLVPVTDLTGSPVAVVQGFGPQVPWRQVIDGAILVREGLPWVASNTDLTVPTERGPGPGNGALVALVAEFSGRTPLVAGKPRPPLFEETLARVGGTRPLVVGDRLDTDIDGAIAVGWDSLLVMTGVTTLADLARIEVSRRPTYVGADLSRLAHPATPVDGWTAAVVDGRLRVQGAGDVHGWWSAVARTTWAHLDETGRPASTDGAVPGSVVA
ncbi:HAD-IIA family hydrolase [Nocardioides marmoriginsengisoli]|uniref:HAD-IIA family hydrolase n=1 Tax=Nocardioides marmoriginsengisoli TaxID=661483 RepID=A0A3N0CJQ6_9ACTN|nr:HAD-IIA family hydrolase [Nocardioides marmoriginsengisoli]RNL63698.1 HAD-IIA family hydrolase [Nocardioides marmoriginsengisoli]